MGSLATGCVKPALEERDEAYCMCIKYNFGAPHFHLFLPKNMFEEKLSGLCLFSNFKKKKDNYAHHCMYFVCIDRCAYSMFMFYIYTLNISATNFEILCPLTHYMGNVSVVSPAYPHW